MEYPVGRFVSPVPAVSPSKTLPTRSPVVRGRGKVGETAWTLCEPGSAAARALVCYQHLSGCRYERSAVRVLGAQPDPVQLQHQIRMYEGYCWLWVAFWITVIPDF